MYQLILPGLMWSGHHCHSILCPVAYITTCPVEERSFAFHFASSGMGSSQASFSDVRLGQFSCLRSSQPIRIVQACPKRGEHVKPLLCDELQTCLEWAAMKFHTMLLAIGE